ncbi:hypothetical protein CLV24_11994 [Pontibacter ummariensis]|uniref:Uncharacterized protein n=1 Tax=Pontibacter ummariensis TaxID=1610492 RepID=A0A239IZF5_9BACT|nr:hypothetical protein [Pontibacter ummariensis]PRY09043.1 hypothetical protein CLV24_11994 [Pontibacter ummariensis]SNS99007.1 hypothetical protein SAMN06296052_11994 [Pontibacter ummariensis]
MKNNRNNAVLERIKANLLNGEPKAGEPVEEEASAEDKIVLKRPLQEACSEVEISNILSLGGFTQLYETLERARGEMGFDRRIVYIDSESAEVLDLLRRKAKIKSNLLVSCLLHEFFSKHKELIQELVEKRNNKLLD